MNWFGKKKRLKRRIENWLGEKLKKEEILERFKEKARRHAFDNASAFADALEAKGYEKLGRGYHSTVFALPKDDTKVIKINHRPDGDGWINYIKWAHNRKYMGNLAPKVYSYKYIKCKKPKTGWAGVQEGFGVALMERLDKTVDQLPDDHDSKVITPMFELAISGNNGLAKKFLKTVNPELTKFAADLRNRFGVKLDLHNGNFMCRKDGSLVLIDPVAGLKATDFKENVKFN